MRKWLYLLPLICVFVVFLALYVTNISPTKESEAATHNVSMTTTVTEYLTFDITTGASVPFGNLSPGTPILAPDTGTIASVATNAANGYTLGLSDGVASTGSCLLHTDTTTRISDYAGSIATPTTWTGTGLGITLYAADTNKEAKWGTGTTYNDANNKYAGIPETATTAHTVTGSVAGTNTSSWAFELDTPNDQKTGSYSGSMTFTATAVLS